MIGSTVTVSSLNGFLTLSVGCKVFRSFFLVIYLFIYSFVYFYFMSRIFGKSSKYTKNHFPRKFAAHDIYLGLSEKKRKQVKNSSQEVIKVVI